GFAVPVYFGLNRVEVILACLQGWRGEGPGRGSQVGPLAIDSERSLGWKLDDDCGRSVFRRRFLLIFLLFFLGGLLDDFSFFDDPHGLGMDNMNRSNLDIDHAMAA